MNTYRLWSVPCKVQKVDPLAAKTDSSIEASEVAAEVEPTMDGSSP